MLIQSADVRKLAFKGMTLINDADVVVLATLADIRGIIEIRCKDAENFWQFSISDNGEGIAPQYHEKIFQIFQTLRPRDEQENNGIGLSLVKKIIESYGGKIWVESQPGEGSTFFFILPKNEFSKNIPVLLHSE